MKQCKCINKFAKFIVLALSFFVFALFFNQNKTDAATTNPYSAPAYDETDGYQISTADELFWYAFEINNNGSNKNKVCASNAKLMNDITINSEILDENTITEATIKWTPISYNSGTYITYTGLFDGNNHTISGIYIENTDLKYLGLFGYFGGTIKNINIENAYYALDYNTAGGIVGYATKTSTIINCSFDGKILCKESSKSVKIGGIAGQQVKGSSIQSCCNKAIITSLTTSSTARIGGIVGSNAGEIYNCTNLGPISGSNYIGGIAGETTYKIDNSYNNAAITADTYAGGIVGESSSTGSITNCVNAGTITGKYAGGILAKFTKGEVKKSTNNGNIIGTSYSGGIAATSTSSAAKSIIYCENYGSSSSDNAGGIIGLSVSVDLAFCNNYGVITGLKTAGGIGGHCNSDIKYSGNYSNVIISGVSYGYGGGIAGFSNSNIISCFNVGNISDIYGEGTESPRYIGGIVGYLSDDEDSISAYVDSCYSLGELSSNHKRGLICGYADLNTSFYNVYYKKGSLSPFALTSGGAYAYPVTEEDIEEGKLCYSLNNESIIFRQKLGVDSYPAISEADDIVYLQCDGTNCFYSNTPESVNHVFVNGICSCGEYEEPELSADGYYLIKNAGNLLYFRDVINSGDNNKNARLIKNIDMNPYFLDRINLDGFFASSFLDSDLLKWQSIGCVLYPFEGTFDGNGYSISNLYSDEFIFANGLFGAIGKNGNVKNVNVNNSCFINTNSTRYFFSGLIYGVSVGHIDNNSVTNSFLGFTANSNTILFEYDWTTPLARALLCNNKSDDFLCYEVFNSNVSQYTGVSGPIQRYDIDLYIVGTGDADFIYSQDFLDHLYIDGIDNEVISDYYVYISEGITAIGEFMFDCSSVRTVSLPSTLKKIGACAFQESKLAYVDIPNGVETIDFGAFRYARLLSYVTVPASVKNLDTSYVTGTPAHIYYGGTKEQYKALMGDTWFDESLVIYESKNISELKGSIDINISYDGLVNPYNGMKISIEGNSISSTIAITNKHNYSFGSLQASDQISVKIVYADGSVFSDLGTVVLANLENYKKVYEVEAGTKIPSITIKVKNDDTYFNDYIFKLYLDGELIKTLAPDKGSVELKGINNGKYEIRILLNDSLSKNYHQIKSEQITIKDESVVKEYSLVPIENVTLTGKIKDADGNLISAKLIIKQKYSDTLIITKEIESYDGNYSVVLDNVETIITAVKEDYYRVTNEIDLAKTKSMSFTLEEIEGHKLTINAYYSYSNGKYKNSLDLDNYTIRIYNETKKLLITDYSIVEDSIYIPDAYVALGDSLSISLNAGDNFLDSTVAIILSNKNAISIVFKEKGYIKFNNVSDGYALVFDAADNFVEAINLNSYNTSAGLKAGNYLIVLIDEILGKSINSKSGLAEFNLTSGIDYIEKNIQILDNKITTISDYTIPDMDIQKASKYLDYSSCGARTQSGETIIGSSKRITLNVSFTQSFTSGKLYIVIPDEFIYSNNSLTVNGVSRSVIEDERVLVIDALSTDNIIRFNVIATNAGKAVFDMYYVIYDTLQPFNSLVINVEAISLNVAKILADSTVDLSGSTIKNSAVELYDNDKLIAETKSDQFGYYFVTCDIDVTKQKHNFYALVKTNYGQIYQSEKVCSIYSQYNKQISQFTLNLINDNSGKEIDSTPYYTSVWPGITFHESQYNLLNGEANYRFCNAFPELTFRIKFSDPNLEKVSLLYTGLNGEKGVIEFVYSTEEGLWIGKKSFSDFNVPYEFEISYVASQMPIISVTTKSAGASDGEFYSKNSVSENNVYPSTVSSGVVTFRINGNDFNGNTKAIITNGEKEVYALQEYIISDKQMYASFDLSAMASGQYKLTCKNKATILEETITIDTSLALGNLGYSIYIPNDTIGVTSIGSVTFKNAGYSDVNTEPIILIGKGIVFDDDAASIIKFVKSDKGLAGTILSNEDTGFSFNYKVLDKNAYVIVMPFSAIDDSLLSAAINSDDIAPALNNLYKVAGGDNEYTIKTIAQMANYLEYIGLSNVTLGDIENALITKAQGHYGTDILIEDVVAATNVFSISKKYDKSIEGHQETGMFGNGWMTDFEMTANIDGGIIVIKTPEENIYLEKNIDKYYSKNSNMYATVSGNKISFYRDEFTYIFNDGLLEKIEKYKFTIYELSYVNNQLISISSDSGLISFEYENGLVSKVLVDGELFGEYEYIGNLLISVTGKNNYYYSYYLDANKGDGYIKSYEANGEKIEYSYDEFGRLIHAKGVNEAVYEYGIGLDVVVKSNNDQVTLFYYPNGSLAKKINTNGLIVSYKPTENNEQIIEQGIYKTTIKYDNGNIQSITGPIGDVTKYTYNSEGLVLSITDAMNNTTNYSYDSNNRLVAIEYPDGTTEEFTYDDVYLLTKKQRNDLVLTYSYNSNGTVARIDYSDGSYVVFTYDVKGDITQISNESYTEAITYDADGLIISIQYPNGKEVQYEYDDLARVIKTTDTNGYVVNYLYDAENRLYKLTDSANKIITEYTFDENGRITQQKNSSSSYTQYTYEDNFIKSITNYGKSKNIISKFIYTYNSLGLISQMEDINGIWYYKYDASGRLIKATSPANDVTIYTYDKVGSRITVSVNGEETAYETNNLNQYTKIGNSSLEYDNNGNLIKVTSGSDVTTYEYNARNQLIEMHENGHTYNYEYDSFGNKSAIIIDGNRTDFYYLAGTSILLSSSGSMGNISYVYGYGLVSEYISSKQYYYAYDAMGSVYNISDSSGNIKNSYTYDINMNVISKAEAVNNIFTYAGGKGMIDDASGLYYSGVRHISKQSLSFTSPDPNGIHYGINMYCYASDNQINNIDTSGEFALTATVTATAVIGAAVGAGVSIITEVAVEAAMGNGFSAGSIIGAGLGGATTGALTVFVGPVGASAIGGAVGSLTGDLINNWGNLDAGGMLANAAVAAGTGALFSMIPGSSKLAGDHFGRWEVNKFPFWKYESDLGALKLALWDQGEGMTGNALGMLFAGLGINDLLAAGLRALFRGSTPIMDPSGFVCEAVESNKLEGVKCTIYYSEYSDGDDAILWNAGEFGQDNPLYSDAYGKYAWDVPTGYWMVVYEMEGYVVAYSEWLPVPPIQLEVNVSLKSYASPEVKSCDISKNEIIFEFTQYMLISNINNSNIVVTQNGEVVSGIFEAMNSEESFDDSSVMLATQFRFIPSNEMSGAVEIKINNVNNYISTPIVSEYKKSANLAGNNPDGPTPTTTPDNPTTTTNDPLIPTSGIDANSSGGISGGAVAGIIIGIIALLGGAGFAIYWFVIRKKRSGNEAQ